MAVIEPLKAFAWKQLTPSIHRGTNSASWHLWWCCPRLLREVELYSHQHLRWFELRGPDQSLPQPDSQNGNDQIQSWVCCISALPHKNLKERSNCWLTFLTHKVLTTVKNECIHVQSIKLALHNYYPKARRVKLENVAPPSWKHCTHALYYQTWWCDESCSATCR